MRLFLFVPLFFTFCAHAQIQIRAGAGAAYGLRPEAAALHLRAAYYIGNDYISPLSIQADGNYYFISAPKLKLYEANLNAVYTIQRHDVFQPYVLTGLNIYRSVIKGVDAATVLGFNGGVGLGINLGHRVRLFGEGRYTLGKVEHPVLCGGLLVAVYTKE